MYQVNKMGQTAQEIAQEFSENVPVDINSHVVTGITITVILAILCAAFFILGAYLRHKGHKWVMIPGSILLIAALTCCVATLWLRTEIDKAYSHGMQGDNITIGDMLERNRKSPKEDTLPEGDLSGAIIIYFKYGCHDCEDVYADLAAKVRTAEGPVYWIASNSAQGQNLREQYPVTHVPAGIYIYYDDKDGQIPYARYALYEKSDEEGSTAVLDEQAIDRLILLQSEKR